ncbi:MAG TPA: hypothetical protein VEQ36_02780, partial [Thermomicrobiales bacterium]|nr:hypothetical protein [Thermomicrobiales bacterium]
SERMRFEVRRPLSSPQTAPCGRSETPLCAPWCVSADDYGNTYIADHGKSTLYKVHIDFN